MPVTPDGSFRDAQCLRDLRFIEAGEVAHLHDLSHARVDGGDAAERLVDTQDFFFATNRALEFVVERHARNVAATSRSDTAPGEVDDHRAHDLRRPAHEMDAILDLEMTALDEAHVRLMNERAGVEQCVAAARTQPRTCQASQVGIGRRIERVGSHPIAVLCPMNQLRQRGRRC